MKTHRTIIFGLALLLTAGRLFFDCGCVYAAPQSLKPAQETAMPCHGEHHGESAKQESSCCGGCKEVRYAVSPKAVDFSASLERVFLAEPALDLLLSSAVVDSKEPSQAWLFHAFSAARAPSVCPLYLTLKTLLI